MEHHTSRVRSGADGHYTAEGNIRLTFIERSGTRGITCAADIILLSTYNEVCIRDMCLRHARHIPTV